MKITYRLIHEEVIKETFETGEEFYYVEEKGLVSEEEAMEYIHKQNFEEFHKRHREFLEKYK